MTTTTSATWILRSWVPAVLLSIPALPMTSADLFAQKVVPMEIEPRHRLMLKAGPVEVLDVQIRPGDTTYFHTHDAPVLYVAMSVSATNSQELRGEWGDADPGRVPSLEVGFTLQNLRYAREPHTHRVANIGTDLFRLIAVVNNGEGAGQDNAGRDASLPGELDEDNRYFRTRRLTLAPGGATEWAQSLDYVVGIQVSSPGWFQMDARGGNTDTVSGLGEFSFARPGVRFRLRNPGDRAVEVLLVEARE